MEISDCREFSQRQFPADGYISIKLKNLYRIKYSWYMISDCSSFSSYHVSFFILGPDCPLR